MSYHRMCGITDAHLSHAFSAGQGIAQLLYACPGVPHRPLGDAEALEGAENGPRLATADDVIEGRARYVDTPGGRADRETLAKEGGE